MDKGRVLITGSNGFIGANISRYLSSKGFEVFGIVRDPSNIWRLNELSDSFHMIKVMTYDTTSLKTILTEIKPDTVINAVGADQKQTSGNAEENWKSNFLTMVSLVNAMNGSSAKLIHLGSSFEYGKSSRPGMRMKEEMPCEPISEYGVVKFLQTEYLKNSSLLYSVPVIVLRIFNVFGPFESITRLIPQITLKVINNEKITLFSPDVVRDFIYIDDVSGAIINAMGYAPESNFEIFNIGTGTGTKVIDVAKYISSIRGISTEIEVKNGEHRPENSSYGPIADISNAMKRLGWKPSISLLDSLNANYQWFLNNLELY